MGRKPKTTRSYKSQTTSYKKHSSVPASKSSSSKPATLKPSSQPTSRKRTHESTSHLRDNRTIEQSNNQAPTKLERLLFSTIIFLIPSNLFLNLTKDNAFVQGILVDYLIPKLYLSDIFIALLFITWLTRLTIMIIGQKNLIRPASPSSTRHSSLAYRLSLIAHYFIPPRSQRSRSYLVTWIHSPAFLTYSSLFFFLILLTSAVVSTNPTSSAWTMIKLFEFIFLTIWIKDRLELHSILKPLSFTIIFQSIIAIIQWIQQRSILGYLFLGESELKINGHLAKTSLGGQLRVLPYGTTAHPNILAGFLVIGSLILLTQSRHPLLKNRLCLAACFLSLISLTLTQSVSAVIALILGIIFLNISTLPQRFRTVLGLALLTTTIIFSIYCLATFISPQHFSSLIDNPTTSPFTHYLTSPPESINRRLQLSSISFRMFISHPILGVGPNNFTTLMSNYGEVSGTTRFLQPVHNIFLLFLTETGLLTFVLALTLTYALIQSLDKRLNLSPTLTVPLIAILIISLFDHYPLSLQSGRLLLALTIGLALSSLNPKNRANFKVVYK